MSFACAMQVNSFRKFHGLPCATTMCIGNIRSATEMLCRYHITKDKTLRRKSAHYYFIILVFAIGATTGALVTAHLGSQAIWGSSLLLLAGFILMFIKEQPVLCWGLAVCPVPGNIFRDARIRTFFFILRWLRNGSACLNYYGTLRDAYNFKMLNWNSR